MNSKISINKEIKSMLPKLRLGVLSAKVKVLSSSPSFLKMMEQALTQIKQELTISKIHDIRCIKSTRNAYKILGKEPSRYRPSAEALSRRIIQEKGMYQVNNVVDLINYVSIKTGFSIGGYDSKMIQGNIQLSIGGPHANYEAIGRGILNIDRLPILRDDLSPFGSPTSDSERTKIDNSSEDILLCIFDFNADPDLNEAFEHFTKLLQKYAAAIELKTFIIT